MPQLIFVFVGRDHRVFDVDRFLDGHFFFEFGGNQFDGIAFHHAIDVGNDTGHGNLPITVDDFRPETSEKSRKVHGRGDREFLFTGKILFLGG